MARYIELVGVPGIGKSTTYKYLRNIHTDEDNWLLLEHLFKNSTPRPVGVKQKVRTLISKILGLPMAPKVKVAHDNKFLFDFMAQNEALIDIFWDITMTKNKNLFGKDLRFTTVNYIMMVFKNLQAILDYKTNKCVVLDEGIMINLSHFTNRALEEPFESQISSVLDKFTLPSGIVFFDGDVETVIERTKIRGKLKVEDENLSDEMLKKSREETAFERRKYVEIADSRGIPILRLDAGDSIESKAKELAAFADSIAKSK
jgi:deoxyadenosine/deoxycytidine kinase